MNRNLLVITLTSNTSVNLRWEIDLQQPLGRDYLKELVKMRILYLDKKERLVVNNTDDKLTKLFVNRYQNILEYNDRYKNDVSFLLEYVDNNVIETLDLSTILYATGGHIGLGKVRTLKLKFKDKVKVLSEKIKNYQDEKKI